MAVGNLPETTEPQTLKHIKPEVPVQPLPEEQNLRNLKPNGQEAGTAPQTLELRTDKKFPIDHPMNPDYVSPVDKALKGENASTTGQQNGNGASNAMSRSLPGEEKSSESKVNPTDVAKENERSLIGRMLTAMGLSPDQKPHAEVELLGKSTGSGSNLTQQDIVSTAQKVTGDDFSNLPAGVRASIADAASGLRNSGSSMEAGTRKETPNMQAMSVVPPQASSEISRPA